MVLRPFWAKHRGSRGVSQHPHTGAGCVPPSLGLQAVGPDSPASAPQKRGTGLGQPAPGPLVWEVVPAESGFQCGPRTANAASLGGAEAGQEGWQGVGRRPAAHWWGDTGPQAGTGPGRPPRGEPAPSLRWEDGETWGRSFSGQAPQGEQQGTPRGPGRPTSAAGQRCEPLASTCRLGNRGSVGLVPGGWETPQAAGTPRFVGGPASSLLLCVMGCPPPAATAGSWGRSEGSWGVLCRSGTAPPGPGEGTGPLNAARGHEQPSPKVACPSDPSRPQGERAGQPPAHVRAPSGFLSPWPAATTGRAHLEPRQGSSGREEGGLGTGDPAGRHKGI